MQKGLPARYLLHLGTLEPRKNLELLVRAFARWRAQASLADQEVRLVLAGGKGWYYDALFRLVEALGLADVVLFPGFVPGAELPAWYQAAEGFVYPSLFEGFGLPVLEAMACGAPGAVQPGRQLARSGRRRGADLSHGRRRRAAVRLAVIGGSAGSTRCLADARVGACRPVFLAALCRGNDLRL